MTSHEGITPAAALPANRDIRSRHKKFCPRVAIALELRFS
jgi:hypothetical protein